MAHPPWFNHRQMPLQTATKLIDHCAQARHNDGKVAGKASSMGNHNASRRFTVAHRQISKIAILSDDDTTFTSRQSQDIDIGLSWADFSRPRDVVTEQPKLQTHPLWKTFID